MFGYLDLQGRVVIPPQFDSAGPFTGGLAQVGVGNPIEVRKYGYIDTAGKMFRKPAR
jgi:hypothetical protein